MLRGGVAVKNGKLTDTYGIEMPEVSVQRSGKLSDADICEMN